MVGLLDLVLDKRELNGINREFAAGILEEWLEKHPDVREEYAADPERFARKKAFQKLRREVRAQLREVYGVFFMPKYSAKRDGLVEEAIRDPSTENIKTLLSLHRSAFERLPYYDFLFQQLFRETGNPKSILDIGCGFNPFAYPFLPGTPAYHSADIACEDLERIGRFLERMGAEHSEHCLDLIDVKAVRQLPRAEVAFAFKVFDSLETLERDVTAQLLEAIPADILVASFPTLSIGQGKPIEPRQWFLRLVTDRVLGTVTLPNEQFLIVTLRKEGPVTGDGQ